MPRRSECLQPGSVPLDFAQSTARASMRTGDWRHRPRYHDPEQISRRQHGKRGHRRPNGGIESGRVASPPISSLSSFSTHPALATEAEGWPSRPCHVLSKASSRPLMNAYRRHWNKGFGFCAHHRRWEERDWTDESCTQVWLGMKMPLLNDFRVHVRGNTVHPPSVDCFPSASGRCHGTVKLLLGSWGVSLSL